MLFFACQVEDGVKWPLVLDIINRICCKKGICNMSDEQESSAQLERRLHQELEQIDRKIGQLVTERDSIRRILMRVRNETKFNVDVTRKNSFGRISVEHCVIETLKGSKKPVPTRRLASYAKDIVYNLKDNTFRSYLYRMKERGLIVSKGSGLWALAPPEER